MFKVVKIDDKKIPMKSNGYTGRLYARFFSKDFLASIIKLKDLDIDNVTSDDLSTIEELAYVLAKTANSSIGSFDEWLGQFDSPFSIIESSEQMMELLMHSASGMTKSKKKTVNQKKRPHSTN